jgi:hypothetical protein
MSSVLKPEYRKSKNATRARQNESKQQQQDFMRDMGMSNSKTHLV